MKGIIIVPIVIKTVGVTIYGGFVLLMSVLTFIWGISSFGIEFRTMRFMPSTVDLTARRDLFYPQFFFQMFSILFLSFLLISLDKQLNVYIFKNEITYFTPIIPLYLFCYFLYSQGRNYFRYTSRINYMISATIFFPYIHIGFILIFFYCYNYLSINILVLSQTLSAFLVAVPCFWIIFEEFGLKFSFYNIKILISDIKVGFPLIFDFIVDFILAGSDRYFIAYYLTVSAVGYYNPGYVLGSFIIFIPRAMGTALPQLIFKAMDSGKEFEAQRMLNYSLKIFLLLAIPFIIGSIVLGKNILTLLANNEVAENAYLVAPIVALGAMFYGLNIILSNVLFVRLKTYVMFKVNLFALVFNLLANLIFLYFFRNIIIAAITTFLSYFIIFIYVYKAVIKEWPVDFQPIIIIKSVMASLVMGGLLFWMLFNIGNFDSVRILFGEIVLGIVTYLGGLLILGALSKKELQFVKSFICRQ